MSLFKGDEGCPTFQPGPSQAGIVLDSSPPLSLRAGITYNPVFSGSEAKNRVDRHGATAVILNAARVASGTAVYFKSNRANVIFSYARLSPRS